MKIMAMFDEIEEESDWFISKLRVENSYLDSPLCLKNDGKGKEENFEIVFDCLRGNQTNDRLS